jgi:hypothetical protein
MFDAARPVQPGEAQPPRLLNAKGLEKGTFYFSGETGRVEKQNVPFIRPSLDLPAYRPL